MIPFRVCVTTLLVLLTGCTAGKKLSYTDTPARVDASGTARVAATVYDQRQLITSGQESPTFIGKEWSLYHQDTVRTASGRPLGDDVTNLLAASLVAKGFKATPIGVTQSEKPDAVAEKLAVMRVDRGVVLTIADWQTITRTDGNSKTQLSYDLDIRVLDPSGNVLAQRRLAGREDQMSGPARDAFRQKLELLINTPEVTQALSTNASPATTTPASGAPSPPAATGQLPTSPPPPDVASQLQKLKELYEKGLVTEDVYKEKMREILNKL